MISKEELAGRLIHGCEAVMGAQDELTEIDSRFGDADHGITMTKIAGAVKAAVEQSEGGIRAMLDDAATAVMMLNGGSAVPLWNTWLDGLQEHSADGDSMSVEQVKEMFSLGCKELSALSKAKVGDKTMMDALIPATEAMEGWTGDMDGLFAAAAEAAVQGAENSRNFVSKFGRARSYGEATIGTPDAGAVSMKYFFVGLAQK